MSHNGFETHESNADLETYLRLKRLADILYDVQDVRIRTENRLRIFPEKTRTTHADPLKKMEHDIDKEILSLLNQIPIWTQWLSKVKGIGPRLGSGLIANITVNFKPESQSSRETQMQFALKTKNEETLIPVLRGIAAFENISKLWAYCGMHVIEGKAPKRKRGELSNWNSKMRTLCWKIGESFVKQNDGKYRAIYDASRQKYDARPELYEGKGNKGHRYAMAKRRTVKLFLADLWLEWRKIEGLSITQPYSHRFDKPIAC